VHSYICDSKKSRGRLFKELAASAKEADHTDVLFFRLPVCALVGGMHLAGIMDANHLQIAVILGDDTTVLSLSGRVSVDSSPMLRNRLLTVLRSGARPTVIVDLTKSPSVDCSGIATLIEALKIARNHHVALQLTGLQGRLKNLFEVTGTLSLFEGSSRTNRPSTSKVI
jgi:anti-anti-sigma factor